MKSLDYLRREACTACAIDNEGVLRHCEVHQGLFNEALAEVTELYKKPTWKQKKDMDGQRVVEEYNMKISHDWAASRTFTDATKTRMAPYPSHCKKCGVDYTNFKLRPITCPRKV